MPDSFFSQSGAGQVRADALFPPGWPDTALLSAALRSPLQLVTYSRTARRGIHLSVKREDLLDQRLGGNKFYKLHGHLKQHWQTGDCRPLASFGGAWSNHLYALAAACSRLGLPCMGVIRGERPANPSPTLRDLESFGMRLVFISRAAYRRRGDPAFIRELESQFGDCYWIPEGGGGVTGAIGCRSIVEGILAQSSRPPDVICHAVGTGTSLAGIASAVPAGVTALGIPVLKAGEGLEHDIASMVDALGGCAGEWRLDHRYHSGGYAKVPDYLFDFIAEFEGETGIVLDPVYTAKLMWSITCLAESGYWTPGTHVVAIHSGGLQGRRGYDLDTEQQKI